MSFLSLLGGIGGKIISGIAKAASVVQKVAPVVSGIAGMIPGKFGQGIASAANAVSNVAGQVGGGAEQVG
jgi:hypothetical protein